MTIDASKLKTRLFINGEFVNSVSGKTLDVINPATEEVLASVQEAEAADVDKAVSFIHFRILFSVHALFLLLISLLSGILTSVSYSLSYTKQVAAAKAAFAIGSPWRTMDPSGRRDLMLKFADLLERDQEYLEELESFTNGKPMGRDTGWYGSTVDITLAIKCVRYYAGWADKIQGLTIPTEGNMFCYTRK